MNTRADIEERLKKLRKTKEDIINIYIKKNAPQGYKSGTSYLDADAIRGSKKEYSIAAMMEELQRVEHMIQLDEDMLKYLEKEEEIPIKLKELPKLKDKVYYLRKVQGYTQAKTAEILGISDRWVRKIETKYKE